MEIDNIRLEWRLAEKAGYIKLAAFWKGYYRQSVLNSKMRPYNEFHEELKKFPFIYLN